MELRGAKEPVLEVGVPQICMKLQVDAASAATRRVEHRRIFVPEERRGPFTLASDVGGTKAPESSRISA
jgi:hypothetical protein